MIKVLFIFGTRPEAIKMAPIIRTFKAQSTRFLTKVCVTAQHRSMLDQVLEFFNIQPDFDLNLMMPDQTLFDITVKCLKGIEGVLNTFNADLIICQGDTTTAFTASLAGYYKQIKVAHIEAGLRSENKMSPYPEEINRILAGHIADFHFAPTKKAVENLQAEGIKAQVYQVGNTVIDALFWALEIIQKSDEDRYLREFSYVDFSKRNILVTGHRRESFGKPFVNICNALKEIADRYPDISIIYPVHLNPNVRKPVEMILRGVQNIYLTEPLNYPSLVWLMNKCDIILTDSGGIQEEAPSLGKPVLVMREVTERQEGIDAGTAKLVGTDTQVIVAEVSQLLNMETRPDYAKLNPYGDGQTAGRIADILASKMTNC